MPSTPEPATRRARTPPTPLHGPQYDNYQPYSPRRSTRTTAQSNPYSSANSDRSPRASTQRHITPPPTAKRTRFARTATQLSSPPSSPASPVRTRLTPRQRHKTPRKQLSGEATKGATVAFSDSDHASSSLAPPTLDPATMLPTPSKTPRRRHDAPLNATARILSFQPENPNDVMPVARKIKKHGRFNSMNGFDLYDEERAHRDEMVEIFTDANARVPELDDVEDNPFIGSKRTSTRPQRRTKKWPTSEEIAMEEAVSRQEGVIFVFRGKKILRRFSDPQSERSSTSDMDREDVSAQRTIKRQAGAGAHRPLTRSAIKPRLLWPTEEEEPEPEQGADDVDEEAVTDVEMGNTASPAQEKLKAAEWQTPKKARVLKLVSPPTTLRATRSSHAMASPAQMTPIFEDEPEPMSVGTDDSSAQPKRAGRKSPFDSWQRTKTGRKRASEAGDEFEAVGKRTRSAVVESPA
ncbi:hypothetical protein LTS09_001004 [Friedmanniomyces endolithicus]|nr:hypothetical protein LTS09_001004 [Friedmanniomyces endolithicus]